MSLLKNKKIVGFIPAKGTSTRLPNKNKRRILGIPLFLWAANNLSRVIEKNNIYVDSEDPEILNISSRLGFNTLHRPANLSNNSVDGNRLLEWEASNVTADVYIQHLPPMIFCKKETILKGLEKVISGNEDSVVYLHGEKKYKWKNGQPEYDIENIPNSFELRKEYSECMGLYIAAADQFNLTKKRISGKFSTLSVDYFEKNDIDYEEDLIQAKALAEYFEKNGIEKYIKGISEMRSEI